VRQPPPRNPLLIRYMWQLQQGGLPEQLVRQPPLKDLSVSVCNIGSLERDSVWLAPRNPLLIRYMWQVRSSATRSGLLCHIASSLGAAP